MVEHQLPKLPEASVHRKKDQICLLPSWSIFGSVVSNESTSCNSVPRGQTQIGSHDWSISLGRYSDLITMDRIQQYFYVGQSDYVICSDFYQHWSYPVGAQREDIYIGAEIVPTVQRLHDVLEEHAGKRVWLITSPRRYGRYMMVSRDIVEFIESQKDARVYRGAVDRTEVYLFAGRRQATLGWTQQ